MKQYGSGSWTICITYCLVMFLVAIFTGVIFSTTGNEQLTASICSAAARLLLGTIEYAGWTVFPFSLIALSLIYLGFKRLFESLTYLDRQVLALIEVACYAIGMLGTLTELKALAVASGLTFSSSMNAFNPLKIGISLWLITVIIGWIFDKEAEIGPGPSTPTNPSSEPTPEAVEENESELSQQDEQQQP